MKSISFKNFRRFADFPEFKFGDITILVGGNNAGKSTLLKALILLIDNMNELNSSRNSVYDSKKFMFNFDLDHIHQLNLGTYKRALNNDADPNSQALELSANVDNFRISFKAGNGRFDLDSPMTPVEIEIQDLKRNIIFNNDAMGFMSIYLNRKEEEEDSVLQSINNEVEEIVKCLNNTEDLSLIAELNERLEKIAKVQESFKQGSREHEGHISVASCNYIGDIINKDYTIPSNPLARIIYQWVAYQQIISGFLKLNSEEALERYKKSHSFTDSIDKGELEPYDAYCEYMEDGLVTRDDHKANINILEDKISMLRECAMELNNALEQLCNFDGVYYIQAHAITQRVLYTIDNRNDQMAQVLHKFSRENILKGTEADRFLCKWLTEFGIGVDYRIKSIEGEGYTLEIETTKGVWQHLADFGMGSNQLVTFLMELATLIKVKENRQHPLIIVEEPEQNLHPKVQSKLADLFSVLNKERGFKFLVETHSEYLIRRTQVLVAEMDIEREDELEKQNPFKVYYFPENGVPYDMKYLPNGHFEESFGKGFFDEAGKWTRELIRSKKR